MTLPGLLPPNPDRFRNIMWFYGLDPAVKVDNFGVVLHGLDQKPQKGPWNPLLREAFEIDHANFTEIIQWITGKLFMHYPPTYAIIDATRDTPTAQEMEAKYGENTVKAMAMTNTLNYELKQNAYNFLEQGYAFPNTATMKNQAKATAIAELQLQTLHERVEWTADNRLKFTHPPGEHNDLNRAWEMGLKAVRDFQLGRIGTDESKMYDDYNADERDAEPEGDPYDPTNLYEGMPQGTFALPYD